MSAEPLRGLISRYARPTGETVEILATDDFTRVRVYIDDSLARNIVIKGRTMQERAAKASHEARDYETGDRGWWAVLTDGATS